MELLSNFEASVIETLVESGLDQKYAVYGYIGLTLLGILILGWLTNLLVKGSSPAIFSFFGQEIKDQTCGVLIAESFFLRISHLAPAFVISFLSEIIYSNHRVVHGLIEVIINLYLVLIVLWVIDAVIDTLYKLYEESSLSSKLPLKGICQAIKIVINVTGVIFILSILLDKSPLYFFSRTRGLDRCTATGF